MTTYTQADADAAMAQLALDTQTLATDQQAVLSAQANLQAMTQVAASADAAVAAAEADLAEAQANAAGTHVEMSAAQAALSSANDAVAADQADMAVQQAIIDDFNAQPPAPTPTPATPVDRTMYPDAPIAPQGPFTVRQQFKVNAPTAKLSLKGLQFDDDYTSVAINQQVELLEMSDCIGNNVGSFIYTASGAGGVTRAVIERVKGLNQKSGRPAFRLYGPCDELVLNDIDIAFSKTANTNTGDIGTGFQLAEKFTNYPAGTDPAVIAADRAKRRIKLITGTRIHISGIYDNWPTSKYWNGDGVTCEESADEIRLGHLYMHDITDGGVDFKAPGSIEFIRSERVRAGVKLWASMRIGRFVCIDPVLQGGSGGVSVLRLQGHKTNPPVIQIDNSFVHSDKALVRVENGPVELHYTGKIEGGAPLVPSLNNGGLLLPSSTLNGSAFPKK